MSKAPAPAPDAAALFAAAGDDPALDEALLKDPRELAPEDLARLVEKLRLERALFIKGGRK